MEQNQQLFQNILAEIQGVQVRFKELAEAVRPGRVEQIEIGEYIRIIEETCKVTADYDQLAHFVKTRGQNRIQAVSLVPVNTLAAVYNYVKEKLAGRVVGDVRIALEQTKVPESLVEDWVNARGFISMQDRGAICKGYPSLAEEFEQERSRSRLG